MFGGCNCLLDNTIVFLEELVSIVLEPNPESRVEWRDAADAFCCCWRTKFAFSAWSLRALSAFTSLCRFCISVNPASESLGPPAWSPGQYSHLTLSFIYFLLNFSVLFSFLFLSNRTKSKVRISFTAPFRLKSVYISDLGHDEGGWGWDTCRRIKGENLVRTRQNSPFHGKGEKLIHITKDFFVFH